MLRLLFTLLISANVNIVSAQDDSTVFYNAAKVINEFDYKNEDEKKQAVTNILNTSLQFQNDSQKKYFSLRLSRILYKKGYENEAKSVLDRIKKNPRINKNPEDVTRIYYEYARIAMHNDKLSASIKYLDSALSSSSNRESKLIALCKTSRGRAYYEQGKYGEAIQDYLSSFKWFEKNKVYDLDYGQLLHFIGSLYKRQNKTEEALSYYLKEIELGKQINEPEIEAEGLYLAAGIYAMLKEYDKEAAHIDKAIAIYKKTGNESAENMLNLNRASALFELEKYDEAERYLDRCKEINKRIKDPHDHVTLLRYYGKLYAKKGNYEKSIASLNAALEAAKKMESKRIILMGDVFRTMSDIQYDFGHYKEAIENLDLYQIYYDSLINLENINTINSLQASYENEKKEQEIALLTKDKILNETVIAKQKQTALFLLVGIALIAIFSIILFKRYKVTQRQKLLIEANRREVLAQKKIVEEQNKEILDSIEYAKRIQATILPPLKVVKKYLDDSFILYLPKDIVAGDFYWMETVGDYIFFAACDCTGHGVPGALVSVVCNNALNRSIKEFGLTDPGKILDKVAELVIADFSKDDDENVKDGMDASVCSWNTRTGELYWAGANNPIWIIHHGEIKEIKANKQPIGKIDDRIPFTSHLLQVEKGDTLYLFTDGYADQFGGINNKKLTKARFKEVVLSIAAKNLTEQRSALLNFLDEYKGKEEQVDDILIMGIKVDHHLIT